MNALQGFAIGFAVGALYVMFALPWLQRKLSTPGD